MTSFQSCRVVREFTQNNPAPPEKVFPLLCPVREADYLPGWQYRLVYSVSGLAEPGCVFTTPNPPGPETAGTRKSVVASETTWIVSDYDPAALRIAFVWFKPGMIVTEIRIQLTAARDGTTRTHIRYRYTGLSEEGNRELETYDGKWFEEKMRGWERMMNHYLDTGNKVATAK